MPTCDCPVTKQWISISGNNSEAFYSNTTALNQVGAPPARRSAASWIDSQDQLWIFGGFKSIIFGPRKFFFPFNFFAFRKAIFEITRSLFTNFNRGLSKRLVGVFHFLQPMDVQGRIRLCIWALPGRVQWSRDGWIPRRPKFSCFMARF